MEEINHPNRYNQGDIECIDCMKAATIDKNGIEAICVSNIIKYIWRYKEKNGIQDIKKAQWYLDRLLKEIEQEKLCEKTVNELYDTYTCEGCKYSEEDMGWDDKSYKCTEEPCASCKGNFIPNTNDFKNAKYNYVKKD